MFSKHLSYVIFLFLSMIESSNLLANTSSGVVDNEKWNQYIIGAGIADVTGPALGNPMWGYGKPGQNTEGIHTRLKSRAFIFVDPASKNRLLFASVDIGNIEHHVFLEVLDRLQVHYGDIYNLGNTILSATHTHSGPDGYTHTRISGSIAGMLDPMHFERIVSGIVSSIVAAHNNLQPGNILINRGDVIGAGANRSMKAYNANPASERTQYTHAMDLNMTLLRLQRESGAFASINWFAVHPTSMTFDNKLISSDHKGYASLTWEQTAKNDDNDNLSDDFIAAFAQSTPGDVTPNLNLNNTGPGDNDMASTQIIGQRQLDVAQRLFNSATKRVTGPIDSRQLYINMANFKVSDTFTGAGEQTTCPSAYGYAFAGGSTEDGGGHFLFSEGMKQQKWWLDLIIRVVVGTEPWTQSVKDCQSPKPILFETGSGAEPLQSQIRSLTVARLGSLAIVAMPTEITTMSSRRIQQAVKAALGPWVEHIVIAGYSNGYGGYITTPEEYETQQYEGGHTVHGKWTLPAYIQALSGLAKSLDDANITLDNLEYDDWRNKAQTVNLFADKVDTVPNGQSFGEVMTINKVSLRSGETVTVDFWSGHPSTGYRKDDTFVIIEQKQGSIWVPVLSDMAWSTVIRWKEQGSGLLAAVSWTVPKSIANGTYRIKHLGNYRLTQHEFKLFEGVSPNITVVSSQ
ncbi:neutral/alkaline non-lysosomal ceramidase N-terminal domain-containing protein [uncultured Paraglaciecola sp.]|mgnify:CR=1 FL=1|uniref:neutral/alkaline non-lysosomal ceramidase N-terminal domain-containing protein n=1 Tax=uncultured Paraglaciecola sp. TaxID=1765024 RepID=UPI002633CC5D|nr:neutral/alkaline non-lysosomal ceramidase N-terminal domain-containing protein [uncultured Paraglaciecola sp.]